MKNKYWLPFVALFLALLPSTAGFAQSKSSPDRELKGFNNFDWGSSYSQVLERFKATSSSAGSEIRYEILNAVENREILVQSQGIVYRYVFYQKPAPQPDQPTEIKTTPDLANKNAPKPQDDSRLFFVETNFPLVAADELAKRLEQKYGDRTNSTVDKAFKGAYIWDLNTGVLFQWIQAYARRPYSRTIYYISKPISLEIRADLQVYQFEKELSALENLQP